VIQKHSFVVRRRYSGGVTTAFGGRLPMSIGTPAVTAGDVAQRAGAAEAAKSAAQSTAQSAWVETAIAVGFAVTAVLFVSFVAVMTGLA